MKKLPKNHNYEHKSLGFKLLHMEIMNRFNATKKWCLGLRKYLCKIDVGIPS